MNRSNQNHMFRIGSSTVYKTQTVNNYDVKVLVSLHEMLLGDWSNEILSFNFNDFSKCDKIVKFLFLISF